MQTFLTHWHEDALTVFRVTAKELDWQRLGKQRVEALQIINTITRSHDAHSQDARIGWVNHPAVRMWRERETLPILWLYHDVMIQEWIDRGYRNNMAFMRGTDQYWFPKTPAWITPELVRSHQSNLIRKKPEHYRRLWPDVPDDLPYIWPV